MGKLGAKLTDEFPTANCQQQGDKVQWGYHEVDSEAAFMKKIKYESYKTLKAEDICGGTKDSAKGTPCFQAKNEQDLLKKMSQAVAEVFQSYEPLIQLCKNKISSVQKESYKDCTPNVQDVDVRNHTCDLSYDTVKDNLDLFIKSGKMKDLKEYKDFDEEVKTVAQAAFMKAGGVCLKAIDKKERIDWNTCKIVSDLEADQLLKYTGVSIVIFIATLVWGLALAALIWGALNAYKACKNRRQQHLGVSA